MSILIENISSYYEPIEMPGGWLFNHVERLKEINRMAHSQYKDGKFDDQGFYKFFYNISYVPRMIARKFIDLDSKDALFIPSGSHWFDVWLSQKQFKIWLKNHPFSEFLNDTADNIALYGGSVGKKVKKGDWKVVSYENLRYDTTKRFIKDSHFVYEVHYMTKHEIQEMDWDNKEELFDRPADKGRYYVLECYYKDGKDWKRKILAEPFMYKQGGSYKRAEEAELNSATRLVPAIELDKERKVEFPYREVKTGEIKGRHLPLGTVEILIDPQIAINEAENLERKSLIYSSMQLWQTRDETMGGNNIFSTGVQNGDIMKIEQEITKVDMIDRNTGNYNNTRNRWENHSQNLTFSTDVARGDNLPSRTPLGVAQAQIGAVSSFFEEIHREKFGMYIKSIIVEDILPSFKSENASEHLISLLSTDEELDKFDKAVTEMMVTDKIVETALDKGFFPSQERIDQMRDDIRKQLSKKQGRDIKIPKGFHKRQKYTVDVVTTGESFDIGIRSATMQIALQIIGSNPEILKDKTTRNIFFKFISLGGISPVELGIMQEDEPETTQQPLAQGGSISAPNALPGTFNKTQQI